MAKQPEKKDAAAAEGDKAAAAGKPRNSLLLFGGIGAVVVLLGGGAAAYFTGFLGGKAGDAEHNAAAAKPAMFVDLPELVVNLSTLDQRATYLKLKIALEVSQKETLDKIQPVLPRVLDAFQVYLRELRTSDLDGSAGLFRVKEELQRRVNIAIYPQRVDAVLFKEILIQ
eukprot:gene28807-32212_t